MGINGVSGINSAIMSYVKAASNISSGNADIVKESVNMINAQNQLEANSSVIKTQDDMMGSLLDIKA